MASWNSMSTPTRVGVVAVGLAMLLLVLAVAGVFSSSGQKLTAGSGPVTTRPPADNDTTTTDVGNVDTTLPLQAGVDTSTTLFTIVDGTTSDGSAVASTGGHSASGSGSSSGSSTSPGGSTSGGHTPPTKPPSSPATTAPTSGGCPTARPSVQVTSFQRGAPDSVENYPVDVSGVVRNGTSSSIDLFSVTLNFYDAQGELVDTDSVQLDGSLAPGESRSWSTHSDVDGTNGEPTHATGRLRYDWTDTSLDRCPT